MKQTDNVIQEILMAFSNDDSTNKKAWSKSSTNVSKKKKKRKKKKKSLAIGRTTRTMEYS